MKNLWRGGGGVGWGGDNAPRSGSIPHGSLDPWIQLELFHLSPETVKKRQADQHISWSKRGGVGGAGGGGVTGGI